MRRVIVPSAVTVGIALVWIVGMLAGNTAASGAAPAAAGTQQAFLTLYGWWDNTPPGGDIAYPQLHKTAGGTGTYADPITFATYTGEVKPGGRIFVPRVGKYFIMEDGCDECKADWTGKGPDGGPGLWHFDMWEGGKGGNPISAIECEDALTNYNADNTPNLEPVVVDPPANEAVSTEPIFDTGSGRCFGGAKPVITVGQYKNNATGLCLDDPGDKTTAGWTLAMAACDGSPEQQFTFDGTFLSIHAVANQQGAVCADSKSGPIVFKTCTGGPTQQWSANTNLTISDIQTGKKCFTASGSSVTAGSCTGAAAQWTFPTATTPPPPPPTTTTTTPPPGGTSYEAENAGLAGGASAASCQQCSGGKKVGAIGRGGTVTFTGVGEPADGSYPLTVYYLSGSAARSAVITVNGVTRTVDFPQTNGSSVGSVTVTVSLIAGNGNTISFANPTAASPSLDRIVV